MPNMGDQTGAEGESKATEGADTKTADQNKGGEGQDSKADEGKSDKKDDTKESDDDADKEPPTVKRSRESYIIERKDKKIQKLKEKQENGGGSDDDDEGAGDDDDDEIIDPTDKKIISKEVNKALKPILDAEARRSEEAEKVQIKQEVNDFLSDPKNAPFKPFQAKIEKYAQHESRKHLPISSIAYEVAGPSLLRIGAEEGRKADKEAKDSEAGGSGGDSAGAEGKSVWDLTPEEFKAKQQEVLRRRK